MNWLCWHVGTVTDPKFGIIAAKCKTPRANVIALWAMILESARDGKGVYSLAPEDAAFALGIEEQTVIDVHEHMIDRGLVDGERVQKWIERQGQSNSERAREYRERQKAHAQQSEQTERSRTSANVGERRQTEQTDTTDRQTEIRDSLTDNNTNPAREKIHALASEIEAIVVAPPEFAFGLPSAVEMMFREGHTELEIMDAARVIAAQGKPIKNPRYLVTTVRNRKSDATRQTPSPRKPRYNPADASSPDAVAERRAALARGMRAILPAGDAGDGTSGG